MNLVIDNQDSASLNYSYNEWGIIIGNKIWKEKSKIKFLKNNSCFSTTKNSNWKFNKWGSRISVIVNSLNTSKMKNQHLQKQGESLTNSEFL